MTQDEILKLPEKNNVKALLLNQIGLSNKEIAALISGGNTGRTFNDLKMFAQNPAKIKAINDKYFNGE